MTPPRAERSLALVVLALGALLYLAFLGTRDLWYPDEPDVAEPAREMLVRGDWVTPTQNGEPWIDYPPLAYWAMLGSAHALGGMNELTLRLPSAIAAIVLALALARFAAARFSRPVAWIASLALLTFPHFALQATNAHPDMLFALGQGAGLMLYAAAERWTGSSAWFARVGAFALFGLAFLAKGPLGLLLPGLILCIWHLSFKQVRRALLLAPLALVTLAVVFPWYAAVARAQGTDWVVKEFLAQNFARFAEGTERGHARPVTYYFLHIWAVLGLWALCVPAALLSGFRPRFWSDPQRRLVFLWAAVFFVFLTLAATKRAVYLLPAFPAFALWIGLVLSEAKSLRGSWMRTGAGALLRWLTGPALVAALFGTLLGVAGVFLVPHLAWNLNAIPDDVRSVIASLAPAALGLAGVCALGAVLLWKAWRHDRPAFTVAGLAVLHGGIWLVLMALVGPRMDPVKSYAPHARWLGSQLPPAAALGFYHPGREVLRRSAFLYYSEHPLRILATADELAAYLAENPRHLAVVGAALADRLLATDPRFAGTERRRFEVTSNRWVVLGAR